MDYLPLIILATSIWVLIDAKTIGVEKNQISGMGNMGPWGWFFACLLLWIIGFPLYLAKRSLFKSINTQPTTNDQKSTATHQEAKGKLSIIHWLGIIVFTPILILSIFTNIGEKSTNTESTNPSSFTPKPEGLITATAIVQAYEENTVAADKKFKGKIFKITGTVASINTDFMGNPYISLKGGVNQFMEPQFSFDKAASDRLASLRKGESVSIICTGKGDIAKTPMWGSCAFE